MTRKASRHALHSIMWTTLTAFLLTVALTLPTSSGTKRHANSYAQLPAECREAWKMRSLEDAGPSGYCVPPKFRDLIRVLAPYGSQHARDFYDDLERAFGGSTVD